MWRWAVTRQVSRGADAGGAAPGLAGLRMSTPVNQSDSVSGKPILRRASNPRARVPLRFER